MSLFKIAITGGIGTGKSTIAKLLSNQTSIPIVDADKIAREVIQNDVMLIKHIVQEFGDNILHTDGTLNRKMLGDIIFNDIDKRIKLNNIMFPAITHEVVSQFARLEHEGAEYVIYDAPLLYDSGTDKLVDYIIVVIAPEKDVVKRLKERNNFSTQEATARIAAQTQIPELLSYNHDYIISNSLSFNKLKTIIKSVWREIQSKKIKHEAYSN